MFRQIVVVNDNLNMLQVNPEFDRGTIFVLIECSLERHGGAVLFLVLVSLFAMKKIDLSDWLKARVIILAIKCVAMLNVRIAHAIGRALGQIVYRMNAMPVKIARKNIGLACPHLTPLEVESCVRDRMRHLGMLVLETGIMWERSADSTLSLIHQIEGEALLLDALESDQGLITLVPHHGNWELAGLFLSHYSPMAALYKPPRIASLDHYMRKVRGRRGSELVPTTQRGVMRLFSILKQGGMVGILPDQSPDDGAIEVPFMGHPARTMRLASRLIQRTGARVLVVVAVRRYPGSGFEVRITEPEKAIQDSDEFVSSTAMNSSIERAIERDIDQYQWEYKRYRGTTRYAGIK